MKRRRLTHLQIIALGYFCIIVVGTLLLMLPVSSRDGQAASPITALFTSVSASCVTGLIVQDTATYWSVLGQIIIILLIQIGGLGYMTIATFFYRLIIKKRGLREKVIMAESINTTRMNDFSSLIKHIVLGTAVIEISGAILLSVRFIPMFGLVKGIYYSIFHSISAFCNAGFDLFGSLEPYSSLTYFYDDALVTLTVSALIILGGLGFLVWDDISQKRLRIKRCRLHTKIVVCTTFALLVGGTLLFFIFEQNATAENMSLKDQLLTAFFNAVTPRTAGFNSVDTASLSEGSKLLTVLLMFIGGSSGSTAGGIKTTTVFVLIAFAVSSIRGRDDILSFNRRINSDILKKALLITVINLSLALFGTFVICTTQPVLLTDALFEAFSAIGTVGMTTGITRSLNTVSKIVLIFLMYCGRVGSISFASALFEKRIKTSVSYPAESVTVG